MPMKKVAALLALALAAVALVACGGDDDDDTTTTGTTTEATQEGGAAAGGEGAAAGGAGGSTFKVAAVPDTGLAYTTTEATAKAGDLTIEFENPQTLTHDVAIEDASGEDIGKTDLIADDTTTTTIKDVKPGKYTFYCTVPGHREGGMEGTLTVK
jgi:plastocyanin